MFVAASSAKETEEKTPTRQSATNGKKTFSPIVRIISVIVMAALSLVNRDYAATLATAEKIDCLCPKIGFSDLLTRENPQKFLFLKPNSLTDSMIALDDLLIDLIFVKVKIFPEFRHTRPSMSQCILKLQIDSPAIGLDPGPGSSLTFPRKMDKF